MFYHRALEIGEQGSALSLLGEIEIFQWVFL